MPAPPDLAGIVRERLLARNEVSRAFFDAHAEPLAHACRMMADRFLAGGRLLAFGKGAQATDAQHVSVEFVHPVIVGKRALPALDLSAAFEPWVASIVRADDMVIGFGPAGGDEAIDRALARARSAGAMTLALPGPHGDFRIDAPAADPFMLQEIVEILYHTLWETVHVFFEHHRLGHDVGASGFLYPFLGAQAQDTRGVVSEVAESIRSKAQDDERLRTRVATDASGRIAAAVTSIAERLAAGGVLIAFGNGGSATDANDLVLDCVDPPAGMAPVAALSLAMESPNVSAIANDVGAELVFLRQMIAQARSEDVAVAFSTSGNSRNIVLALEEARRRGLLTVALLGDDGGEVVRRGLADIALVVPSDYIPRIQEIHASIYHVARQCLGEVFRG